MKRLFAKYKPEIIGGATGALAGWSYWYFVGCASGTCAITSSPVISTLYGALMGGLLLATFSKKNTKTKKSEK